MHKYTLFHLPQGFLCYNKILILHWNFALYIKAFFSAKATLCWTHSQKVSLEFQLLKRWLHDFSNSIGVSNQLWCRKNVLLEISWPRHVNRICVQDKAGHFSTINAFFSTVDELQIFLCFFGHISLILIYVHPVFNFLMTDFYRIRLKLSLGPYVFPSVWTLFKEEICTILT